MRKAETAKQKAETVREKKETVTRKKETLKQKKERALRILALLDKEYGTQRPIFLNFETDWQLLVATILSAQCTDQRVNLVTKSLFQKYKSLAELAEADLTELEQDIRSTGFYRNKAKNILLCAGQLLENFEGKVPSDIEELTSLAGVGRKTANVIRGTIYKIPSIVVDTHVMRISNKLGMTSSSDPVKIEFELMKIIPKERWILWNTHLITLGRTICIARRERCGECFLSGECPGAKLTISLQNP